MTRCPTPTNDAYLQPALEPEIEYLMRDPIPSPIEADRYEALIAQQRKDYEQRTQDLVDQAREAVFSLVSSLAERGVDPAIIRRAALDAETVAEQIAATIRTIRKELF